MNLNRSSLRKVEIQTVYPNKKVVSFPSVSTMIEVKEINEIARKLKNTNYGKSIGITAIRTNGKPYKYSRGLYKRPDRANLSIGCQVFTIKKFNELLKLINQK